MKKTVVNICVFVLIFMLYSSFSTTSVFASELEEADVQKVKVLVIGIDPELKNPTQNNTSSKFYGKKTISATEYLGFSLDSSASYLKKALEDGTNGTVKFEIVEKIRLAEFPTYDGYASMTEEQFFELFTLEENGTGQWGGWWTRNSESKILPPQLDGGFNFDYEYLLDKLNLVEKKNKNEFDMVWVFSIDPSSMYETCMVGKQPIFINGRTVKADCENFVLGGFTFSRKDGSVEAFCHYCESMLNYTYGVSDIEYNASLEFKDLSELSTWEKFWYNKSKASAGNTVYGVGQVHFSPNSTSDYEWESDTPVQSYYLEFANDYPHIDGDGTKFTASSAYLGDYDSAAVSHHVWWMKLMPHYKGRDENGYLHNWWRYILNLKYTNSLSSAYENNRIELVEGDILDDIAFTICNRGATNEKTTVSKSGAVLSINGNNAVSFSAGKITALKEGKATATIKYDGHELVYDIIVKKPYYTVEVVGGSGSGEFLAGETVTINAAEKEGYKFINWEISSKSVSVSDTSRSSLSFEMIEEDVIVTAKYEAITYTITAKNVEHGTVTLSAKSGIIGDEVIFEAEADADYKLSGWEICYDGKTVFKEAASSIKFTMQAADVEVNAIFEGIPYSIIVSESKEGNIEASTEKAIIGTEVKISALPNAGYSFKEWVVSSNVEVKDKTAITTTFKMTSGDVTVAAVFEKIPYNIDVIANGKGTASANKDTSVMNEKVTLTAEPMKDYRLKEWVVVSGDVELKLEGDMASFVMPSSDVSIEAVFEGVPYEIKLNASEYGTIIANYEKAPIETMVELSVESVSGYGLKEWVVKSGNAIITRVTDTTATFIMPSGGVEIDAVYEKVPFRIKVNSIGEGTTVSNVETAELDEVVELTATPSEGYKFIGWEVLSGNIELASLTETKTEFSIKTWDVEINAVYEAIPYTITLGFFSNGSASVSVDEAIIGSEVILKAEPREGYYLSMWEISSNKTNLATVSELTTSFIMPAESIVVTPVFENIEYALTITSSDGGSATASNNTSIIGENVELHASPAEGYAFKEWIILSGDVVVKDLEAVDTSFLTKTSDVTIKAVFEGIPYSVSVDSAKGGNVNMSTETAIVGTIIQVEAVAEKGYSFKEWNIVSGNVTLSDEKNAVVSFTMPAEDVILEAVYINVMLIAIVASMVVLTIGGSIAGVIIVKKRNKR